MIKHFNTKHCKSKISQNSKNNFFIIPNNINKIITKFWNPVTEKGGPTNPHNVTDDPTCLDSDGSFLGRKQTTTLINFGRVSSRTLRSLPDGDLIHSCSTEMSAGARASSFTSTHCNFTSTHMHTTSTKANPFKTEPQQQNLRVSLLSLSIQSY